MHVEPRRSLARTAAAIGRRAVVMSAAMVLTLALFLVLPLLQQINQPLSDDLSLRSVDTVLPTPDPVVPEPEPEPEEEEEIPEPDLTEDAPPLDLSQLEMALNPGLGSGWSSGDFAVGLGDAAAGAEAVEELFSSSDLDQKPRPIYQPSPRLDARLRSRGPGQVFIIFIIDANGRVEDALVQKSSDPIFERSALTAIRQWKFEPGRRNGEPVRFRMRQRFDFPKE
jgi:protein TonB